MSSFTGDLTVTQLSDNYRLWRIERELIYEVGFLGSGRQIKVPEGFVSDGATTKVLRPFLPAWGKYSRAVVIHDYLCICWNDSTPHVLTPRRIDIDSIFYEAMIVLDVDVVTRYTMYIGVRIGSYYNWARSHYRRLTNSQKN